MQETEFLDGHDLTIKGYFSWLQYKRKYPLIVWLSLSVAQMEQKLPAPAAVDSSFTDLQKCEKAPVELVYHLTLSPCVPSCFSPGTQPNTAETELNESTSHSWHSCLVSWRSSGFDCNQGINQLQSCCKIIHYPYWPPVGTVAMGVLEKKKNFHLRIKNCLLHGTTANGKAGKDWELTVPMTIHIKQLSATSVRIFMSGYLVKAKPRLSAAWQK